MKKVRDLNSPDGYLNVTNSKGFSLIEMLVAMMIFSVIASSAIGFFIFAMRSQIKILASQKVVNETSYVMEYMSRYLRMARKELNCDDPANPDTSCHESNPSGPHCLNATDSGFGYNYEVPDATSDVASINRRTVDSSQGDGIKFINYKGQCQEFYVQDGVLWQSIEGTPLPITSDNVEVTALQFKLVGQSQADNLQPKVTFSLTIRKKPELKPEMRIQTTISQRDIDSNVVAP